MKCPFCSEPLLKIERFDTPTYCDSHDGVVVFFINRCVYLCKDGFEISYCMPFGSTIEYRIHEKRYNSLENNPFGHFCVDNYYYYDLGEKLFRIKSNKMPTPETIDDYIDRCKKLVLFL